MKKIIILFSGIILLCSCGASKMNMAGCFESPYWNGSRIVSLSLNQDSTFKLQWGNNIPFSGKWSQKGNDYLFLSYDTLELPWCLATYPFYFKPESVEIISINKIKYSKIIKFKRIKWIRGSREMHISRLFYRCSFLSISSTTLSSAPCGSA